MFRPASQERQAHVLLVDDDEGDAILIREALAGDDEQLKLHVARDGVEAMAYLRSEGRFAAEPRPDLILLDLNMPRKNGFEVISEVRADQSLKNIPVIILTTSSQDRDVMKSYLMRANCVVIKPSSFEDLTRAMQALRKFWLNVAVLPS